MRYGTKTGRIPPQYGTAYNTVFVPYTVVCIPYHHHHLSLTHYNVLIFLVFVHDDFHLVHEMQLDQLQVMLLNVVYVLQWI
jgi:hypothetical protein